MTTWTSIAGPELIEAVGWCLVHSVWQAAAVALVALLVLRTMDRSKAQARYVVACASLVTMVLLPVSTCGFFGAGRNGGDASLAAMKQTQPGMIDGDVRDTRSTGLDEIRSEPEAMEIRDNHNDHSAWTPGVPARSRLELIFPWLVSAWGAGVLGFAVRLIGGWLSIQWLARHGTKPVRESWAEPLGRLKKRLKLARAVRLLESARVQMPLAIGWIRPVILLPVTATLGPARRSARGDPGPRTGPHPPLRLPVQPGAERGRDARFLPPGCLVDLPANPRRARELLRRLGNRALWGPAGLCSRPGGARGTARCRLAARAVGGGRLVAGSREALLGVAPLEERPAGGLAGTFVLAAVGLLGLALFLMPPASEARAAIDDSEVTVGTVETRDGKPAEGVEVWLVTMAYPGERLRHTRQGTHG